MTIKRQSDRNIGARPWITAVDGVVAAVIAVVAALVVAVVDDHVGDGHLVGSLSLMSSNTWPPFASNSSYL